MDIKQEKLQKLWILVNDYVSKLIPYYNKMITLM